MLVQFHEIEEKIFAGLKEACSDSYSFSGDAFAQIEPEYIVTTNVAKSIKEINDSHFGFGYPLIIVPEEDTKAFATECVPQLIWDDIFSPSILNDRHNSERNGKIDIAVYEKVTGQLGYSRVPRCCIEIKKFAPIKSEVLKDIVRNIEYMNLHDSKTGGSHLEKVYFACLENHHGCQYKRMKPHGLKAIENKYRNMLLHISSGLNAHNLVMRFEVKTVAEDLLSDNPDFSGMDDDNIADKVSQLFHHVGVLVVVERIPSTGTSVTVN